jgi:hypothetical protein
LRVRKVEGTWTGNYLLNGVRVAFETDAAGNPNLRYTATGDSYYDRIISMRSWPSNWEFRYHLDALGSVGRWRRRANVVGDEMIRGAAFAHGADRWTLTGKRLSGNGPPHSG